MISISEALCREMWGSSQQLPHKPRRRRHLQDIELVERSEHRRGGRRGSWREGLRRRLSQALRREQLAGVQAGDDAFSTLKPIVARKSVTMRKPSDVIVIALPGLNAMITFALPTPNAIARAFFTKIGSSWTKSVDMRATSGGTMSDSHSRRFATWAFSFEPLGRNPQIAAATHISTFFVHDDPKSRKNAHSETAPDRRADIGTPHIRQDSSGR